MHFTVYGTGAIGGSLGAYMVRAGEDVLFVDKSEDHVAHMKREGLKVDGYGGEVKVQVNAVLPQELSEPLSIVMLAVKSQHTEEAVRFVIPVPQVPRRRIDAGYGNQNQRDPSTGSIDRQLREPFGFQPVSADDRRAAVAPAQQRPGHLADIRERALDRQE